MKLFVTYMKLVHDLFVVNLGIVLKAPVSIRLLQFLTKLSWPRKKCPRAFFYSPHWESKPRHPADRASVIRTIYLCSHF